MLAPITREFGQHFLIELIECEVGKLQYQEAVRNALLRAAKESNATIIHHVFHQFEPQGVSGVVLISESHFSIHTWPESGYAAAGIFTCGESMNPQRAIDVLREELGAQQVRVTQQQRGY